MIRNSSSDNQSGITTYSTPPWVMITGDTGLLAPETQFLSWLKKIKQKKGDLPLPRVHIYDCVPYMNTTTHGCDYEDPCKISTALSLKRGCVLWAVRKNKMSRPSVRPPKLAPLDTFTCNFHPIVLMLKF